MGVASARQRRAARARRAAVFAGVRGCARLRGSAAHAGHGRHQAVVVELLDHALDEVGVELGLHRLDLLHLDRERVAAPRAGRLQHVVREELHGFATVPNLWRWWWWVYT